jgi:hypothetical protein
VDTRTRDKLLGCALGVIATVSCGGITETVETMRARNIQILDASGAVRLDVGAELASLRARVERLEAALSERAP